MATLQGVRNKHVKVVKALDMSKVSSNVEGMKSEQDDLPDPDALEELAEAMPRKVTLRNYVGAMGTLRAKGYSYQEVAEWLSKKLGAEVTRSQVSYLLNIPDYVLEREKEEAQAEEEADEREEESARDENG